MCLKKLMKFQIVILILKIDLINFNKLKQIFCDFGPDLIIHLAGLKSVSESNRKTSFVL